MSDLEKAYAYALQLADALRRIHYPENEQWKPLPDLVGLLTQIDNMTADLVKPDALEAQVKALTEALTPSGATKAAYICEFSVPFPILDEDGNDVIQHINVPWVTIKEIMKAISARAALQENQP